MVQVLPDGIYLSVLINPAIPGARRRKAILADAAETAKRPAHPPSPFHTLAPRRLDQLKLRDVGA